MSNDFLMAKSRLPPGTVDLGVGEPHLLRLATLRTTYLGRVTFEGRPNIWEYAPPNGCGPLVKRLEDRYGARVVVTVGAKQGLLAACHAVRTAGAGTMSFRLPYWASIPHVVRHAGLKGVPVRNADWAEGADSCLLVSPNNPDGASSTYGEAKAFCDSLRDRGIPVVHDGAYFTHAYLPKDHELGPLGDLQVFSASKMYGLSGLRLGWVVCHDDRHYEALASYVEASTAGVSTVSQRILLEVLEHADDFPYLRPWAEELVSSQLADHRSVLSGVDPSVLSFAPDASSAGMFAWAKLGSGVDLLAAGVYGMPGEAFGDPGFVRLNLSVPRGNLVEAVSRMNRLVP